MPDKHVIFGSELSPYSVKVRSWFRYKGIPHEWLVRSQDNMAEFQRHAKLPLIPLVVLPDGSARQDSTPIIEALEADHPEPSIHPGDAVAAFVSVLLEEYGDEWLNKPMFHYRWHYEADRIATAERIAASSFGASGAGLAKAAAGIAERMHARLHLVGSSPETAPFIEQTLHDTLELLEAHLAERPYLFGARPAFGDFGLFAQLYECSTDPTAGALMRATAPATLAWCERMLAPVAAGRFEAWPALAPTLRPLLANQVGAVFLPWSDANARALAAGAEELTVDLKGTSFSQQVQKYHARSLASLRRKYAGLADRAAVDEALAGTGCLPFLATGG